MNAPSALLKCTVLGLLVGVLANAGPDLVRDILPMAGLMVLVTAIVAVFELTKPETASVVSAPVQPTAHG